jgi:hypothetical protein
MRMWVVENKDKVFFYQKMVGRLKVAFKIIICLSPLAYKLNGKSR